MLIRATREDRATLVGLTSAALADRVREIAEHMARDARHAAGERASQAAGRSRSSIAAIREMEAWRLAFERKELIVVCDELRKRVDSLLRGVDLGEG